MDDIITTEECLLSYDLLLNFEEEMFFKILSGIQQQIFILTLNMSNFFICNFHKKAVIVNVTYS